MLSQQLFVLWNIFSRELGEGLSRVETVSASRCRAKCLERTHVQNAVVNNVILFPPPRVYKKTSARNWKWGSGEPWQLQIFLPQGGSQGTSKWSPQKDMAQSGGFQGGKKRKPFSTAFQTFPASVSGTLQKNQAENATPPPTSTLQTGFQVTQ